MKKLLFILGGALTMAACSEAPTTPSAQSKTPAARPNFDLTCKGGYLVAYDEDGNPYCAPAPNNQGAALPATSRP